MPHFIVELPRQLTDDSGQQMTEDRHGIVMQSGLFEEANVKVRIIYYDHYLIAGKQQDFVNIFGYIMPGRTAEQEKALSDALGNYLTQFFPNVPVITVNIDLLNKANYFKRLT